MDRLLVVHAPAHAAHRVREGVWCGARVPLDELPERVDRILAACVAAGAELREANDLGLGPILAVHDEGLVEVLRTAHARWVAEGHLVEPGAPDAIPYLFPGVAGRHGGRADRPAATIRVQLGRYATDTLTPVGAGAWAAALGAAHAAATAADLVLAGAPFVYAACRPPGHHAGPTFFGGPVEVELAGDPAVRWALLAVTGTERQDLAPNGGLVTLEGPLTLAVVNLGPEGFDGAGPLGPSGFVLRAPAGPAR